MGGFKDIVYTRRSALALLGIALPAAYLASRSARGSQIPFLITADVHDQPNLQDHLSRCLDCVARMKVRMTFFVPAVLAVKPGMGSLFRRMISEGHQVACHGLEHDDSEDYYNDAFEVQKLNLSRAKQLIEGAIGIPVTAFRAPEFRISKDTLNVLDALGFAADLSICSQRLPLLSSQIGNYHWLFSPRVPYHPSATNPYARGDLKLLEIPTSAALLPLMSALNSVSVMATKVTTSVLRYEASLVGKPIVYQCHPEDFVLFEQHNHPMNISWRNLIPTRHGIPLRWALESTDQDVIYHRNQDFLAFLMDARTFRFLSVDDYLKRQESVGVIQNEDS
jgi:peptidoglycan-N-acetylglucosamine deacetylase